MYLNVFVIDKVKRKFLFCDFEKDKTKDILESRRTVL